jgi:prevent-host-death family protein
MQWQLQEAKQRFSEVVRAAEAGEPQIVTRHGQAIVVIVDFDQYQRSRQPGDGLMSYLRVGADLDDAAAAHFEVERSREPAREIDLAG